MAKRRPALVDPRVIRALQHPIRVDIFKILSEGPSSPARIQRQLDNVSLNLVSHHMKVLKDLGCVELLETVSKRGAKEHIYRIVGWLIIDSKEWETLTRELQQPFTATVLGAISEELTQSLVTGRFEELPNNHLSRAPLKLDREGWGEVGDILAQTLHEVLAAGERSLERIEAGAEVLTSATVAMLVFPNAAP